MIINESILDDLETTRDDAATKLSKSSTEIIKSQLTHHIELIIKQWIPNGEFPNYIKDVSKALVIINRQIDQIMESLSFIKGYEVYYVYGDELETEEDLSYDGDSIRLEHTPDESHGSIIIDLYFVAPKFKYTYIDRFTKIMFMIKSGWNNFYVNEIRVKNMHGKLNPFSDSVIVENDIYTEYYDLKRYDHFLIVMKQYVQEMVPLGEWYKYVSKKNLIDEQNYYLLDLCSKGDVDTKVVRLGMTTFPVTDLVKRYKYINIWAMNIAKNGGLFKNEAGNFYKNKSDNPDAKKDEFLKAVNDYLSNIAKSFRLYEGSGGKSYQMYIVFEEPFIFMDVEYVLIWGGSDYQSEDVIRIARILTMLVLAGETPERTVERYLSKRRDAYPRTLKHDLLEVLNFQNRPDRNPVIYKL